MKLGIFMTFALVALSISSQAEARGHHRHHRYHNYAGTVTARLSQPCQTARSLGGPCGCITSERVFGHSVRGLWTARSWHQFPRTSPHPGAVAIWHSEHHVEVVVAVNGDGSVTTSGSRGARRVSLGSVTFVDPTGGSRVAERDYREHTAPRYARHYAVRHGHRHYARHRRLHYARG